ncbi:MAG TPA: hypothetical protein VNN19_03710 [bacterium]|nr:hypothetical protein [bacterium]
MRGFLEEPGRKVRGGEGGAALVTVLLFVALVFILITAMLNVSGNEIVIAGLQRDGVRAMELAQAAIQEAMTRVQAGRPYLPTFTSSLAPACPATPRCVTITVVNQYNQGDGAAYLELRADATVGRSTRRLSALVLARAVSYPPDITFAASVSETGSAEITCGDAYAQTFLQYKNYPNNSDCPSQPAPLTYAGWRVSKVSPGPVAACYSNAQCVAANPGNSDVARWYPGTRQSANPGTIDPETGQDIGNQILNWANAQDTSSCPTTTPVSTTKVADLASPGDKFASVPYANQDVSANPTVPLYGFDTDGGLAVGPGLPCGLPYVWVRRQVFDETGAPAGYWWFKTIVFKQWLDRYWFFDENDLKFKKGSDLAANPAYGTVPPFPDFSTFTTNYDCKITGGGTLNTLPVGCIAPPDPPGTPTTTDLGCLATQMACSPTRPKVIVLEGDWTVNGTIAGHGTLIVNGNMIVSGTFDYWGTIVVNGTLQAGTGNVNIHGGLVAQDTLKLIGNITVEGGTTVGGTPPTGPANVIGKAWWER